MNGTTRARTRKHAPASHYVLAVVLGVIVTVAVSLVVGASNREDFWLAAGVCALCTAYPAVSLGVRVFVTDHTVTQDSRGEESVELAWMRQASAGAFLDVLVATILISVVLMFQGHAIGALPVLVALIALSAVDAGLRYVVIRYRALR